MKEHIRSTLMKRKEDNPKKEQIESTWMMTRKRANLEKIPQIKATRSQLQGRWTRTSKYQRKEDAKSLALCTR